MSAPPDRDASIARATHDLVARLSHAPRPVRRLWPPSMRLAVLGSLQLVTLALAAHMLGLRADLAQKLRSERFLIELGFEVCVAIASAAMALLAAVPGREPSRRLASGYVLLAVVALVAAFSIASPVEPPGPFVAMGWPCAVRTVVVAALPWLALGIAVRRGATLVPGLAGTLTGAASFLLATASLRTSCPLDSAAHLVVWHLSPVLAGILASALIGSVCLSRGPRPGRGARDAGGSPSARATPPAPAATVERRRG